MRVPLAGLLKFLKKIERLGFIETANRKQYLEYWNERKSTLCVIDFC